MKKFVVAFMIAISLFCISPVYAAENSNWQFYFFGVDLQWAKTAKWEYVAAGVATSVLVHVAGHYIAADITGSKIRQDGFKEIITYYKDSDARWIGRAGFIAQNGIALILTSFEKTRQSDFTRGFVIASALETWTYPVRYNEDGDLAMINKAGGNKDIEYGIYSAVAAHNMLRLKW